jgi:hypothetical protein
MLKISKKYSLYLSLTVSVLFFLVCVAGSFMMPRVMETLVRLYDTIHAGVSVIMQGDLILLYFLAYSILVFALLADVLLVALLLRVYRERVFTDPSVALIRSISWCCFFVAVAFVAVGFYFHVAWCIALAAAFLGLCVRVTKNVIEEATEIKSENDLTV